MQINSAKAFSKSNSMASSFALMHSKKAILSSNMLITNLPALNLHYKSYFRIEHALNKKILYHYLTNRKVTFKVKYAVDNLLNFSSNPSKCYYNDDDSSSDI